MKPTLGSEAGGRRRSARLTEGSCSPGCCWRGGRVGGLSSDGGSGQPLPLELRPWGMTGVGEQEDKLPAHRLGSSIRGQEMDGLSCTCPGCFAAEGPGPAMVASSFPSLATTGALTDGSELEGSQWRFFQTFSSWGENGERLPSTVSRAVPSGHGLCRCLPSSPCTRMQNGHR